MIFCQYNYKNYHNDNTDKHPTEPYRWDNWVNMVNDNQKYCSKMNWIKWIEFYFWVHIIRRCTVVDLPSFHKYWKLQVNKDLKIYIEQMEIKYEECKKTPDRIKYLFNATTSLQDIEDRIIELRGKLL